MTRITKDILLIEQGAIAHQVECDGHVSNPVSESILKKWPIVDYAYHDMLKTLTNRQAFGKQQAVPIGDGLYVINLYTRFSERHFTDTKRLAEALRRCCVIYDTVYVPDTIGCVPGMTTWKEIEPLLLDIPNLYICMPPETVPANPPED